MTTKNRLAAAPRRVSNTSSGDQPIPTPGAEVTYGIHFPLGAGDIQPVGADRSRESEIPSGPDLYTICEMWRDVQQARLAADQRGMPEVAAELHRMENRVAEQVKRALRRHPVWPWLSQFPGLGGVATARLLARIGDPLRFPGQKCSMGHTSAPVYAVGDPCPITDWEANSCPGTMLAPRTTTGTRSLWHYAGLHVVDGHAPRKAKGKRADWDPKARTAVLQPDGIADQIIKHKVAPYVGVYYATKERLQSRAVEVAESVAAIGPATHGAEAESTSESECVGGLRPIQIHKIARTVAAKAFVGDLLRELKRLAAGTASASDPGRGGQPTTRETAA